MPHIPCISRLLFAATAVFAVPFAAAAADSFRKLVIGDAELIALRDAGGDADVSLLIGAGGDELSRYAPNGKMPSQINAFVLKLGGKTILVDSGLGRDRGGKALDALADAGIRTEDIEIVLLTHLHVDHVGGIVEKGSRVFPNARILVARRERSWWLDPEEVKRAAPDRKGSFELPKAALGAYSEKVETFEFGDEVAPGVKAMNGVGHTAGHTVFDVDAGGGKRFLVIGDLVHFGVIQFPNPGVAVRYDSEPVEAVRARKDVFSLAARAKLPIAGMHIAFPGVGTLERDGEGFAYTPLDYPASHSAAK
ncbi:MAG: MBL fold metallo-hydrolase [Planctomycetota bacterium]|jgi:glyoxylase-like metal-dependent hydrolase (beta-lactamase superfamily II)|nr:MBL fold metallo-hydrolase [Planctomycetota bacterium]